MPIQLAFSTVACPEWSLEQVAHQAKAMGYAGVELRTLGEGGAELASDPAEAEPDQVRGLFEAQGVQLVCLSTSLSLHHKSPSEQRATHWQAMRQIELAAALGVPMMRVFAYEVPPGHSRQAVMQRVAEQAWPLVDKAGDLGVQLLFENGGSFNRAKEWWWLFNLIDHPMLGMAWNVANAAAAGEPASVSVPMLNSRIRLAKVKDLKVGEGSGFVQLGEGTVGIEAFIKRLAGIGYDGYISVEWDRLWLPSLAPAEQVLPEAHQRLTGWLHGIEESLEAGRKALEKAAARVKLTPAAPVRAAV